MKIPLNRSEENFRVARIANGSWDSIRVYAFPESYCGLAAVCIAGDIDREAITPEMADTIADALRAAARKARGEPDVSSKPGGNSEGVTI